MYTKKVFGAKDMFLWTRYEIMYFIILSAVVVFLYDYLGFEWLSLPFTPIALIGTAVAFVIGFQNNAAYDRIWEARKIWGGIVNTSRSFGFMIKDMVNDRHAHSPISKEEIYNIIQTLIYRHIAWLTALRYAMRANKKWEVVMNERTNKEYANHFEIPEKITSLEEALKPYLSPSELEYVLSKDNKATSLLYLQSNHLTHLEQKGLIWEFSYLELEALVTEMFTLQGQSERIKNFPYPRQFASLNHYFIWLFIAILPFGIVPQFAEIGHDLVPKFPIIGKWFVWLSIPFSMSVSWVFQTMERIGRTGENPFEGTANDVPISTIARGIEIDLRQMLDEDKDKIPSQFEEHYHVQM